eukprot:g7609.t1
MTGAMMATRLASRSESSERRSPSANQTETPQAAGKRPDAGHAAPSALPMAPAGDDAGAGTPSREAELDLVVSMLDCGLRRLAVGDLSARLERPLPDEFEGLRGDFNRTVSSLDEAMAAISTSADGLSGLGSELDAATRQTPPLDLKADLSELHECIGRLAVAATSHLSRLQDLRAEAARTIESWTSNAALVNLSASPGLDHAETEVSQLAATLREQAFRISMLCVDASVTAAGSTDPAQALGRLTEDLRLLAEEQAGTARRISVLERDISVHAKDARSAMERLGEEHRSVSRELTALAAELAKTSDDFRAPCEAMAGARGTLHARIASIAEREGVAITLDDVLERMARDVAEISYTVREALDQSRQMAIKAEEQGYKRVWLAEHHGMPGIASAATSIVIAHVGAATKTIRVGSGGVMLPNHSPLVIAEQFGTLEALLPGRVDLGLGRAPGTDMRTAGALRRNMDAGAESFPHDIMELKHLLGTPVENQAILAVPGTEANVPLWLLGSSLYSAHLAAALGLPYAFASHFAPDMLMDAIAIYRERFQPSAELDKPYVMVGVMGVAADSDHEAEMLFTSSQQQFVNLRKNVRTRFPRPVDSMEGLWTPMERMNVEHTRTNSSSRCRSTTSPSACARSSFSPAFR